MRRQCKLVLLGQDPRDLRCTLATGINKGRRWPKENLNKPREWRKSGFPGPVLWKDEQSASSARSS